MEQHYKVTYKCGLYTRTTTRGGRIGGAQASRGEGREFDSRSSQTSDLTKLIVVAATNLALSITRIEKELVSLVFVSQ